MSIWKSKKFAALLRCLVITGLLIQTLFLNLIINIKPAQAMELPPQIKINELMPDPDAGSDWIELFNPTENNVDLAGWYLKDASLSGNTKNLSGILYAGSFLALDWNVLNIGGDTVKLYYQNDDNLIDSHNYLETDVTADKTIGRIPNGADNWINNLEPTKGTANFIPEPSPTPTETPTESPSPSPTPTETPTESPSPSPTPTETPIVDEQSPSVDLINLSDAEDAVYDATTFPENINGTASDNIEVSQIKIAIMNNTAETYWNGIEWTSEESWNDADSITAQAVIANTENGQNHYAWEYYFDKINLSYGDNYTVAVYAIDGVGNTSETLERNFSYEIQPPISQPITDDYYNAGTYPGKISGTVTHANEVSSVEILIQNSCGQYWSATDNQWGEEEEWLTANIIIPEVIIANENVYTHEWYYDFSADNLADGETYTITSRSTALAGEETQSENEPYNTDSFTYDITAPAGSVVINDGASITNSPDVVLTLNYDADAYQMRISEDNYTAQETDWIKADCSANYSFTTTGLKTIYVQFKDRAGNVSPIYSDSIEYYSNAIEPTDYNLTTGGNAPITNGNLVISGTDDGNFSASADTTLTITQYSGNPESGNAGLAAFGQYFNISAGGQSAINFPVRVKIYFTQTDLDNAGIVSSEQIEGLFFWNFSTNAWEKYAETGVVMENQGNYVGYVWANVDHFTPMGTFADVASPLTPENLKSYSYDGSIKLTWDKVTDAETYRIAYRKATAEDRAENYTIINLSKDSTQYTINGLSNGQMYQFNVYALDNNSNISLPAVVNNSPQASASASTGTSAGTVIKSAKTKIYTAYGAATTEPAEETKQEEIKQDETQPEDTTITTEDEDLGNVAGDETTDESDNSSRSVVTIAILIIAAGAGLGGYYGYQWWMSKEAQVSVKTKTPPTKPEKDTSKDKTNRW